MPLDTVTTHDDAAGAGTLDSFFDVFADVILRPIGPGQVIHGPAPVLHLENVGGTWSHQPPPGYPESRIFPANGVYPGPIPHQGAHPVEPSAPEPSTLLLAGWGIAALAAAQRLAPCRRIAAAVANRRRRAPGSKIGRNVPSRRAPRGSDPQTQS